MPNKKSALKVPKKIKVGYSNFTISSTDKDWKIKNKAVGLCAVEKSLIEYCKDQSDSEIVNTIIHEILHAVIYIFDVEFDTVKKEEYVVKKLANGLQTLFIDNPEFLSWLMQVCKK